MKRIKITAVCISLLATLSLVGCITPSTGYYSGMSRSYAPSPFAYDNGCDPCGIVESGCGTGCGTMGYGGNPCAPQTCVPRVVDCQTTFSHLGNGVLLIGRGILDVTAAPFVLVGNALTSNCRYEVLTRRDNVVCFAVPNYQTVEPCGSACTTGCTTGCASGCDSCSGGYTDGLQFNNVQNRATVLPAPAYRNNGVTQASYQEPTAPVIKFGQPNR